MLSDLSRDFRYALRALLRAPTFAATVIATLSLDRLCHGESLDELDLEGIPGVRRTGSAARVRAMAQPSLDQKQRLQQPFSGDVAFDRNPFNRTAPPAPLFKYWRLATVLMKVR